MRVFVILPALLAVSALAMPTQDANDLTQAKKPAAAPGGSALGALVAAGQTAYNIANTYAKPAVDAIKSAVSAAASKAKAAAP